MNKKYLLLVLIAYLLASCAAQRAKDQVQADTTILNEKIVPIQKKMFSCIKENLSSKNTQSCVRSATLENTNAPWPTNLSDLKPITTSFYEAIYLYSVEYDSNKISFKDYENKVKLENEKFISSWKEITSTTVENRYRANAGMPPIAKP